MTGPERDRSRSIIGVHPLLTVEVRGPQVAVRGRDALIRRVVARLAHSPFLDRSGVDVFALRDLKRLWDVLREIEGCFEVDGLGDERFGFGFLAVFGYDAVHYIEDLPRTIPGASRVPDVVLCLHAATLEVDLRTGRGVLTVATSAQWDAPDAAALAELIRAAPAVSDAYRAPGPAAPLGDLRTTTTATRYQHNVEVALDHIRKGDIYQVMLGHEFWLPYDGDELDVYRRMRVDNPSPFMAFVPLAGLTILSASPELHVLLTGRTATMRPIAGTTRRTGDPRADARAADRLRSDEKERAEHVMLVDLCRNDLGRVAETGSVTVSDMMTVEAYPTVFHLVSTVSARVAKDRDVFDVIRATFPAGTMTGAPKIRAMEIIESLEDSRRGVYAGIFGVIGLGGFADLALCIRTIVRDGDTLRTRASAGIVIDSTPTAEWDETLAKLRSPVWAMTGGDLR
jgi:anthranilate synthase component I